ncbi:MAG TPA: hypothetical protein VMW50_12130, partial [Dehalococcoidia bacterium]|nr:hypothetical protein [Dehalococcoidia bacterium]
AANQRNKELEATLNQVRSTYNQIIAEDTATRNEYLDEIAKLEERIRVADAEEPVAWGVFGYFDSKWCLQFPVYSDKISASKSAIDTIFADGNNGDWKVEPLYLHAQIPAEVELEAKSVPDGWQLVLCQLSRLLEWKQP